MIHVDFSVPFHTFVIVLSNSTYRKIEMHDVMHSVRK